MATLWSLTKQAAYATGHPCMKTISTAAYLFVWTPLSFTTLNRARAWHIGALMTYAAGAPKSLWQRLTICKPEDIQYDADSDALAQPVLQWHCNHVKTTFGHLKTPRK
jgi:hypothetical protein